MAEIPDHAGIDQIGALHRLDSAEVDASRPQ
jgi:hypothetical protein